MFELRGRTLGVLGLNTITTSHTASASAQIMGRLSECVRRVLAGEQPRFLVTA